MARFVFTGKADDMYLLRSTDLALLGKLLLGVLVLVLASSKVLAEDSQLAGAWTLVEGRKQITFQGHSHEENLPPWDEHRPFVVINADGSLAAVQGGGFAELDRLRHRGDRIVSPGGVAGYIEVEDCRYNPDSCELKLLCHDTEKNLDYRVSFQLRLMPNGLLSYHHILPYPGVGKEIVTATLKRFDASHSTDIQAPFRKLGVHLGGIQAIAISPDGRHVLTGGRDRVIRLWNFEKGQELRSFVGHQRSISCVAFAPDGRLAVSGSAEPLVGEQGDAHSVRVWDIETGRQLHQFEAFRSVTSVAFSPDGRFVLASGGTTHPRFVHKPSAIMWSLATGELKHEFVSDAGRVKSAVFSPNGEYVLCAPIAALSDKRFCLFDASTGERLRCFGQFGPAPDSLCFSPDGQRILTASRREGAIVEWALLSGAELGRIAISTTQSVWAIYRPHGRRVLSARGDGTIEISDIQTGIAGHRVESHGHTITCISVSADGRHAVSSDQAGAILAWKLPGEA